MIGGGRRPGLAVASLLVACACFVSIARSADPPPQPAPDAPLAGQGTSPPGARDPRRPGPSPTARKETPGARQEPVTFTADQVEYDRENNLVTARGHVEAYQAGRVVRADEMTFNRNTGIIVAVGSDAWYRDVQAGGRQPDRRLKVCDRLWRSSFIFLTAM